MPVISVFVGSVRVFEPGPDGVEQVSIIIPSRKLLRNGQIVIIRANKTYSIIGQEL